MWEQLTNTNEIEIWRGAVFRLPAKAPYEEIVDFMLVEDREAESGLSLIVSTGYKAGVKLFAFPKEARTNNTSYSIAKDWLIRNWNKLVYDNCKVEDVLFLKQYPSKV